MPALFVLTRKLAIAAALATLLAPCTAPGASRPPNIVLVLADDVGDETPGANGGSSYATPVLVRLADEGMRFEHCGAEPPGTPTRVQLMTGQYNVRKDVRFGAMPGGARTFANLLRDAGDATCVAGKWQLGTDVGLPRQAGFAEACLWQHMRRPPRCANPGLENRRRFAG